MSNYRKSKGPIMMLQSCFFRKFVGLLKRWGRAESEAASAGGHGCAGVLNTNTLKQRHNDKLAIYLSYFF